MKALKKMGFPDHASRQHLKHLTDAGILKVAGQYSTTLGRGKAYGIGKKALEFIENARMKVKTA